MKAMKGDIIMDLISNICIFIYLSIITVLAVLEIKKRLLLKKYKKDEVIYSGKRKRSLLIFFCFLTVLALLNVFLGEFTILSIIILIMIGLQIFILPCKLVIKESGIGSRDILGNLALFIAWEDIEKWTINKYDDHIFVYPKPNKDKKKSILLPIEGKIEREYSSEVKGILLKYCGEKLK